MYFCFVFLSNEMLVCPFKNIDYRTLFSKCIRGQFKHCVFKSFCKKRYFFFPKSLLFYRRFLFVCISRRRRMMFEESDLQFLQFNLLQEAGNETSLQRKVFLLRSNLWRMDWPFPFRKKRFSLFR
jgi:hypothetical protein